MRFGVEVLDDPELEAIDFGAHAGIIPRADTREDEDADIQRRFEIHVHDCPLTMFQIAANTTTRPTTIEIASAPNLEKNEETVSLTTAEFS